VLLSDALLSGNVILAYLENGKLQRTACLHQILLQNWGENTMEISRVVKIAFAEQTVGRTLVFDWFCMYKSSVMSVEDAKHSGHPLMCKTDENVDELK
jgi:hypothetical protein